MDEFVGQSRIIDTQTSKLGWLFLCVRVVVCIGIKYIQIKLLVVVMVTFE